MVRWVPGAGCCSKTVGLTNSLRCAWLSGSLNENTHNIWIIASSAPWSTDALSDWDLEEHILQVTSRNSAVTIAINFNQSKTVSVGHHLLACPHLRFSNTNQDRRDQIEEEKKKRRKRRRSNNRRRGRRVIVDCDYVSLNSAVSLIVRLHLYIQIDTDFDRMS